VIRVHSANLGARRLDPEPISVVWTIGALLSHQLRHLLSWEFDGRLSVPRDSKADALHDDAEHLLCRTTKTSLSLMVVAIRGCKLSPGVINRSATEPVTLAALSALSSPVHDSHVLEDTADTHVDAIRLHGPLRGADLSFCLMRFHRRLPVPAAGHWEGSLTPSPRKQLVGEALHVSSLTGTRQSDVGNTPRDRTEFLNCWVATLGKLQNSLTDRLAFGRADCR